MLWTGRAGGRRCGSRGGSASSSRSAPPASWSGRCPDISSSSAPEPTASRSSSARSSSHWLPPSSGSSRCAGRGTSLRPVRPASPDWWSSGIQWVGTVFFNVTTYEAMTEGLDADSYDVLVWTPDARGSVCFLVSGAIAYLAVARRLRPRSPRGRDWWIAAINLLGCIAFGIAAVASYWVPDRRGCPRPGRLQPVHVAWRTGVPRRLAPSAPEAGAAVGRPPDPGGVTQTPRARAGLIRFRGNVGYAA